MLEMGCSCEAESRDGRHNPIQWDKAWVLMGVKDSGLKVKDTPTKINGDNEKYGFEDTFWSEDLAGDTGYKWKENFEP